MLMDKKIINIRLGLRSFFRKMFFTNVHHCVQLDDAQHNLPGCELFYGVSFPPLLDI